jgi:RNA polymerase sigma factor (sigma-70 family)
MFGERSPFSVRHPMQPPPATLSSPTPTPTTRMAVPAALPQLLSDVSPLPLSAVAPPSSPLDDRTLCARALEGDTAAWNALIGKHDHRIVVSLLARGVRIDRAKDLAQEAWIRLIEQQRAGRLSHLLLPGLAIAQAAFLSLEAARRDGSRAEPIPLEGEAGRIVTDLVDPAADAETRLLTSERVERAEKVLATFAPNAREVFRLTYGGDGLCHADVAKKVGLSLQRVRQILCEVRKELRTALEGEGHE